MCGIFGVVKSNLAAVSFKEQILARQAQLAAPSPPPGLAKLDKVSTAFRLLGYLAMSRGNDAAGFAAFTGRSRASETSLSASSRPGVAQLAARRYLHLDGWRIYKHTRSFKRLWERLAPLIQYDSPTGEYGIEEVLGGAKVLLGHTRLATVDRAQTRRSLLHASPLLAGTLLGTHNGGVAMRELVRRYDLPGAQSLTATSSQVIFLVLAKAMTASNSNPNQAAKLEAITEVLTALAGRAALAWVDRTEPTRVYLARTAVSPLAIARDVEGNFYWASRSDWFRLLDERTNGWFGFGEVEQLAEGSLVVVRGQTTGSPRIFERHVFQPTLRWQDVPFWLKETEIEAGARAENAAELRPASTRSFSFSSSGGVAGIYPPNVRVRAASGSAYLTLEEAILQLSNLPR